MKTTEAQNPVQNGSELLNAANEAYRTLHAADAARLYREYLAQYPDRADVRVYLGASLLNQNRLEDALQEAERAVRLEPRYAKAYALLGRIHSAEKGWAVAEQDFRRALDLNPQDQDSWYFLGKVCYATGQFGTAVKVFREALKVGAGQSRVYENLGLSYDALGDYATAETEYRRAMELSRGDYLPYFDYGVFLFKQGRTKESIAVLEQALQLAPSVGDVRFTLARALFHAGDLDRAAQLLDAAPNSKECRSQNLLARIWAIQDQAEAERREEDRLRNCLAVVSSQPDSERAVGQDRSPK